MKNLKYLVLTLVALFVVTSPVFASANAQGCSDIADIDIKIVNAVHTVIFAIQIIVPVLLVIFGSIDFVKAIVASKEDEIKKGQQIFIKRLIAGVLVFFIIAIVKLIVGFVSSGDDEKDTILDCANCFFNGAKSSGVCKK